MAKRCEGDTDFKFFGTIEELEKVFPDPGIEVSGADYNDSLRKRGVHTIDRGEYIYGHITGPCPNSQNGACRLGENCLSNAGVGDPPVVK
jgi:hypothetical protein